MTKLDFFNFIFLLIWWPTHTQINIEGVNMAAVSEPRIPHKIFLQPNH